MKENVLTVVVPCYNEEETLPAFVQAMDQLQLLMPDVRLELLFIDDGSKDLTLEVLRMYHEERPERINYLSFSRNFGKEAAILAGLEHAKGEWVALMDADLQDPPELIKEMHTAITEEGYDVVATRRIDRQGEPVIRSWFANLYYKLNNIISDVKLEEGARDFRLMTQEVVRAVISLPEHNRFSKGIFAWVGFRVKYLEYENIERQEGSSSWSFRSLFNYAIDGLISFSELPLTIASFVGFVTFGLAFLYGLFIAGRTLLTGTMTPGWTSLAVLIVGMGGLQLLCLGIIGKYIAKIFLEVKRRPAYIIQERSHK